MDFPFSKSKHHCKRLKTFSTTPESCFRDQGISASDVLWKSGSLVLFSTCRIEPELEDFLSKEEKFSFLGFEFPPHFEPQQEVASTLRAQAQETDGAVGKTQGDLPTVCEPTRRQSDRTDQSDPARLGELLCSGTLGPMLFDDRRLGGEEDSAALDACPATQRIRLETVE